MTALRYVGAPPDTSDYAVMNKGQVESAYEDTHQVDASYVTSSVQDVLPSLASLTYCTAQDSLLASSAAVLAADANYVLASEITGVSGGVVPLDLESSIPLNRIPDALRTSRPIAIASSPTVYLSAAVSVGPTAGTKLYKAASLTIADPGYPYIPLPFAMVTGGAKNSIEAVTRSQTTSSYGQLTILATNNVRYGWSICGGRKVMDMHQCLPFADSTVNPTTRSLVEGSLTLDLWLGLYGGTTYTFQNTASNLVFYAICFPGVK